MNEKVNYTFKVLPYHWKSSW